jgi:hypothetical protein
LEGLMGVVAAEGEGVGDGDRCARSVWEAISNCMSTVCKIPVKLTISLEVVRDQEE